MTDSDRPLSFQKGEPEPQQSKRAWIRRNTKPIKRGGRPNARNAKRHAKEVERANGPVARREWIKSLPSVVSGLGPCEAAHVRTGGTSRKADACWTVPLTHHEHIEELHHWGKETFEAHYRIDLDATAERIEAAWQQYAASNSY